LLKTKCKGESFFSPGRSLGSQKLNIDDMIEDAMKDNASAANKDDSYESNFIKHSTNNSELNDSPFNVK